MFTQLLSNLPIPPSIVATSQHYLLGRDSGHNFAHNNFAHKNVAHSVHYANTAGATKKHYPLHQYKVVAIGRDDKCSITLPTAKVSRQHCRIYWNQNKYIVEDLHSKNGTYANGEPCKRQQTLEDGDEIQIGFGAKLLFDNNQLRMVGKALL